ncbi:MAG: class I tRNA ligase family protein, partial [Planctomycetota bacterium]
DKVDQREDGNFHKETGEKLDSAIEKMSKSLGNVVNPDHVVKDYGADTLRLYEMFMGPLDAAKPWDPKGINGVHRFLGAMWRLVVAERLDKKGKPLVSPAIADDAEPDADTERMLHQTIRKVTEDIEGMRFNTALAQMMTFRNHVAKLDKVPRSVIEPFVLLVSPFAPHLGEELWMILGHKKSLAYEPWPVFDPAKCEEQTLTIAVQVLGKTRGAIDVPRAATEAEIIAAAKAVPAVERQIEGKEIKKSIYVPGKIVNFITGK